jgi:hypothetical protein
MFRRTHAGHQRKTIRFSCFRLDLAATSRGGLNTGIKTKSKKGGFAMEHAVKWPEMKDWFIPWLDGPNDPQVYGQHTKCSGYRVASASDPNDAIHYFGGTIEYGGMPTCTCGFRMQSSLRLNFSDPKLKSLFSPPSYIKNIVLPYCIECSCNTYLQVFKIRKDNFIAHLKNYGPDIKPFFLSKKLGGEKLDPQFPDFPLIPIKLIELRENDFPITKCLYEKLIVPYRGRIQVGGFPLFPALDMYTELICPFNKRKMTFLASIAEHETISYMVNPKLELLLGSGGLYYYIDWDTGLLASVMLRT